MSTLVASDLVRARANVSTELITSKTNNGDQEPPNCDPCKSVKLTAVSTRLHAMPTPLAALPALCFSSRIVIARTTPSKTKDAATKNTREMCPAIKAQPKNAKPAKIGRTASDPSPSKPLRKHKIPVPIIAAISSSIQPRGCRHCATNPHGTRQRNINRPRRKRCREFTTSRSHRLDTGYSNPRKNVSSTKGATITPNNANTCGAPGCRNSFSMGSSLGKGRTFCSSPATKANANPTRTNPAQPNPGG